MQLGIREGAHSGVPVVSLTGELDLSTVPRARNALQRAGIGPVVVDLDGIDAIDDVGLGVLVGAAGRARSAGADLVIVCTDERLLELLHRTGVDRAIEVRSTVAGAVALLTR